MATHRQAIRVYFEDTDAAGIVYYANWLRFAERARTDMLRDLGVSHAEMMRRERSRLVVRRCEIDYLKPAKLDDAIEIVTSGGGIAWCVARNASSWRAAAPTALVRAELIVACMNDAGKPVRLPPRVHEPRLGRGGVGRGAPLTPYSDIKLTN